MELTKAVHIVQGPHVRDEGPAPFAEMMEGVKLAVCNMAIDLATAHRKAPWVTFAAAVDCTTVTRAGTSDSPHGSLRRRLEGFMLRGPTGVAVQDQARNYYLRPEFDAYDAYAKWIAENLAHFPALYVDQAFLEPPLSLTNDHGRDVDEFDTRWVALRDYFLNRVFVLWPNEVDCGDIVLNVGGGWGAIPDYDGFCVESEHIRPGDATMHLSRFINNPGRFNTVWRPLVGEPILDPAKLAEIGVLDGVRI